MRKSEAIKSANIDSEVDLLERLKEDARWNLAFHRLRNESGMVVAIVGATYVDELLKRLLRAFLIDQPKEVDQLFTGVAPLSDFSSKIKLAYCIGLITRNEQHDLDLIRSIRNEFAHDIQCSFSDQRIVDKCHRLKRGNDVEPPFADPSAVFAVCVSAISGDLRWRAVEVKRRRCVVLESSKALS